jgi:hypothetical protein
VGSEALAGRARQRERRVGRQDLSPSGARAWQSPGMISIAAVSIDELGMRNEDQITSTGCVTRQHRVADAYARSVTERSCCSLRHDAARL